MIIRELTLTLALGSIISSPPTQSTHGIMMIHLKFIIVIDDYLLFCCCCYSVQRRLYPAGTAVSRSAPPWPSKWSHVIAVITSPTPTTLRLEGRRYVGFCCYSGDDILSRALAIACKYMGLDSTWIEIVSDDTDSSDLPSTSISDNVCIL